MKQGVCRQAYNFGKKTIILASLSGSKPEDKMKAELRKTKKLGLLEVLKTVD